MRDLKWYIVRKIIVGRWEAYQFTKKPKVRAGVEIRGPYKSLITCMAAAEKTTVSAPCPAERADGSEIEGEKYAIIRY